MKSVRLNFIQIFFCHLVASYAVGAVVAIANYPDVAWDAVAVAPIHVLWAMPLLTALVVFSPVERPPVGLVLGAWATYCAVFAILRALLLRRKKREAARRDQMLCVKCSYDVRASPVRCPECGEPVERQGNN